MKSAFALTYNGLLITVFHYTRLALAKDALSALEVQDYLAGTKVSEEEFINMICEEDMFDNFEIFTVFVADD